MDFKVTKPLIDPFERAITYLRVSVTDRCDFRCVYCMAEDMVFLPKADVLTLEELDRMCSAFVARGVRKLRLTGGEPLVRRNIMWLFRQLSRHLETGALDELTLQLTVVNPAVTQAIWSTPVLSASMCRSTLSIPKSSRTSRCGAGSTK